MPTLQAGSLRHRIQINAQSTTADESGQLQQTWTVLYQCWAAIAAITSKELYSVTGYTSDVTHKITIRYPAVTVKPQMQVAYQGRTFIVQAISDPDETKKQLDLLCLEKTDA